MCGVAGISLRQGCKIPSESLKKFIDSLKHRGPDGNGQEITDDIALLHTRLAIIDLEKGDQPITNRDGVILVANGEIYNDLELRKEMQFSYKTGSDCESALAAYSIYGERFSEKLRGMWGLAIFDPESKELVVSRDPFGIKPLYYAETDIGFLFASEPRALIQSGLVEAELNQKARDELLTIQFTTGRETIYRGIYRIVPGEILIVRHGKIIKRTIHQALPSAPQIKIDKKDALKKLEDILFESVALHQRSDVPYGMFLSGGIDSTALLVAMSRVSDKSVHAYTASFDSPNVYDESSNATEMAKIMGAKHEVVSVSEEDFWSMLPLVISTLDDPIIDYAVLPTFKLASVASNEMKVILSGEGGDELFAGYGRYRKAIRPWWLGGSKAMRSNPSILQTDVLRELPLYWRDGIKRAELNSKKDGRSALQVAQAIDCQDWLPNDLLIKLDRCLMAHSVEGRTPFLDPVVASFAFSLPDNLKVRGGRGKWLLRRWLYEQVPTSSAFERKRGFTVPVGDWISKRANVLGPLVAKQPGVCEICKPEIIPKLFEDRRPIARNASWFILFYALWHNYHILGLPIGENIAESLISQKYL
tara:strand:+ start:58382 stop:60151 length:1770 start_codon:yes stop_codon:yes gene_type:complete